MKRRLFNVGAGLSLLLAVAFAGLWVWSYWRTSSYGYYAERDQGGWYWDYYVISYRGTVSYIWFRQGSRSTSQRGQFRGIVSKWEDANPMPWLWAHRNDGVRLIGFHYKHLGQMSGPLGVGMGWRDIGVPHWFLIALAMVMPVTGWRRRKEVGVGECAVCGYDMRATPQAGGALLDRCPECGAAVASASLTRG